MPDRPEFPGQHRHETVIFKLRRHWFILLRWLIPPIVLFMVTVGIGIGIGFAISLSMPVWAGLVFLLSLIPLGLMIWRFLDWENDHYILTNERVLHIERVYFLFESRDEAPLRRIQDVTVRMPSLMANVLYFGDVVIETAGTAGQIRFESVAKPRKVQRLIFKEAGIPEPGTRTEEDWQPEQMRLLRPLEVLTRMLYPVIPRGGEVTVWRKHWYVLVTKLVRPLLLAAAVFTIWAVILLLNLPTPIQSIPETAIKVVPGILFLVLVAWIVWVTIDWHNDLYVLTDTHVIDIEKRPFTLEFRREANLGMIQNVSYEQPSFIAKLLNFGNTVLETAGTMGKFTFDSVPNPRQVQEQIIRHLEAVRRRSRPDPVPRTREELEELIQEVVRKQRDSASQRPGSRRT